MTFICYSRCTTCKKALKWLQEHQINVEIRDIKSDNPNSKEIEAFHKKSSLPLKKFFNTSGTIYRREKIKDKIPTLSEKEQYELLATDGMLVKRPLLINKDFVLVGFHEDEWSEKLL